MAELVKKWKANTARTDKRLALAILGFIPL
jgi:hypothetical protein